VSPFGVSAGGDRDPFTADLAGVVVHLLDLPRHKRAPHEPPGGDLLARRWTRECPCLDRYWRAVISEPHKPVATNEVAGNASLSP
jgi:hypothetical protein